MPSQSARAARVVVPAGAWGTPGGVGEHMGHGDGLLAVGGELGPVLGDRVVSASRLRSASTCTMVEIDPATRPERRSRLPLW
jgi:hypothetical protein